ncbi:MAG: DUF5677 domain-containing protein [Bacilli bacterium]|nr:DUF5677 domain-containing protein [Bacilli bacterium]
MNIISKEDFNLMVSRIDNNPNFNLDFLYEIYVKSNQILDELLVTKNIPAPAVNSYELVSYVVGEYSYFVSKLSTQQKLEFENGENVQELMPNIIVDKYLSLNLYLFQQQKLVNKYLPPISSVEVFLNVMQNFLKINQNLVTKSSIIVDLLNTSISISKSIIKLLCDGYETEAFAIWRTLHECEATLLILEKHGDVAINAYLKHMAYGLAYRKNDEEGQELMKEVFASMEKHDLKKKDTKKFIEYGWLYEIPGWDKIVDFKLNFRNGIQALAGLTNYATIYMNSSEILHSTPMLIYSNRRYYYSLTLICLYESFFRIESVFEKLYLSLVDDNGKKSFMEMKKMYYSQLNAIHKREADEFNKQAKNQKEKDA